MKPAPLNLVRNYARNLYRAMNGAGLPLTWQEAHRYAFHSVGINRNRPRHARDNMPIRNRRP